MAAVERLEALLHSLEALKPPGASGAKIQEITTLCIENIQYESELIQKIYTQVRKCPASHKLGVLYVVDSVTRQWIAKAGQSGQQLAGKAAPSGTYAAGVHKMTEILPHIVDELLLAYPDNQKDKIRKLIDIWDNAGTFPKSMIAEFRHKLNAPGVRSRTPPGHPPANLLAYLGLTTQPPPAIPAAVSVPVPTDSNSILAALASLGKPPPANPLSSVQQFQQPQQYQQPQPPQIPQIPQISQVNVAPPHYTQPAINPPPASVAPQLPFFAPPAAAFGGFVNNAVQATPQYGLNGNSASPVNPVVPPVQGAPNAPVSSEIVMQLLQMMAQGQLTPEQSIQVMSLLGLAPPPAAPPAPLAQAATAPPAVPAASNGSASNFQNLMHDPSRQNGNNEYPGRRNRERSRSRSPDFRRERASPPNRRDSPTYGTYDPSVGAEGNNVNRQVEQPEKRSRGRGRRGEFRQRTPPAQRKPAEAGNGARNVHKNYEYDFSLPKGHIKVLSRTLFVGGVLGTEEELRAIFSRFGSVQTCTVNREKRHAFVKMHTRKDAVAAHAGMQTLQDDPEVQSKFRQTRWGVGFGPREYHNYDSGVSVIPIKLLTEADRKWVVTAEYGGTGGEPIQEHLVIEEPDIEIGAGVSSKALSRRVGPAAEGPGGKGRGGNNPGGRGARSRNRKADRQEPYKRFSPANRPDPVLPEPATIVAPPPVPGFGFQLPGMR